MFAKGAPVEGPAESWKIVYADGRQHVGPTRDGLPDGHGTSKWPDGETYTGGWVRGKRAGRGIAVFADGTAFDGQWQDDHPALAGGGTFTDADGAKTVFKG